MGFITGVYTDIGSYRESNQDSCCVMEAETIRGKVIMAIVCDGMGGLAKGEVASASVIRAFEDWFTNNLPYDLKRNTLSEIKDVWVEMIHRISDKIKTYEARENLLMGTTFSGILIVENELIWVHAGDSRIYYMDDYGIRKITTDHTAAEREVRRGNLKPEEVPFSKLRSKLTQCIGASKVLEPECGEFTVTPGDAFLICSDGFYHKVSKEEIYAEVHEKAHETDESLKSTCVNAVRTAMARGEKDNITVVTVKVV